MIAPLAADGSSRHVCGAVPTSRRESLRASCMSSALHLRGFWATLWCLFYETAILLRDAFAFGLTELRQVKGPYGLEMKLRSFLEAYPRHANLMPDLWGLLSVACWLLMICLLLRHLRTRLATAPEVLFFPDASGTHVRHLCHLLRSTRRRMWIAMFTLTDDVLSEEVLKAWQRGVDVRVIMDDEQCNALGSDAAKLSRHGVPLLMDDSPARMHHKFAVLDACVLTGSFNWTKQASTSNWENLCILRDPQAISPFAAEFQRLWRHFPHARKRDRTPG